MFQQDNHNHSSKSKRASNFDIRSEAGYSLVELVVVMAMMSILALGSMSLITAIFDTNIKSAQIFDQQTEIQTAFGYMNSHIQSASRPIGRATTLGTSIDPLTIAGDQVIFEANGTCYRLFYLKQEEQIRVKVAASCNDSSIKPVRGPNQQALNGTLHAGQGDADYDPALDIPLGEPGSSFVLARGVVPEKPGTAPAGAPAPLQVFNYLADDENTLQVDAEASNAPSGHSSFYNNSANRAQVAGIQVWTYIEPTVNGGARISAKAHSQKIWIGPTTQSSVSIIATPSPGTVLSRGRIDGANSSANWIAIGTSSAWTTIRRSNTSGDNLETPLITSANAWIEYEGQLVLRSQNGAATVTAEIRAELLKNGASVATGRGTFISPTGNVSVARAHPFTGQFQIPVGTASASDNYRVRISVRNLDALNSLGYSTDMSHEWLSWRVNAS